MSAVACFELPIVIISPTNQSFPTSNCQQKPLPSPNCMKEPVQATVEVIDGNHEDDALGVNCMDGNPTSSHSAEVHYRGQTSLQFNKHQFSVAMQNATSFLGFPPDKAFVLNGPWIDGSLLRNHLAHWLFRGTGRYSPHTRYVVVFQRKSPGGPLEYQGIYLALEAISYGPNRVALATLGERCQSQHEFSGGWAWRINPIDYGTYSPNTVQDKYEAMFGPGARLVLTYPQADALTQSMRNHFVDVNTGPLPQLYRTLYDHMKQPAQLERHLDLGSFVDYFLHTEMAQNTDAYRKSAYFFKDRGQPINAGPVWDFNLAYGKGPSSQDWTYTPFNLWKQLVCHYKFASLVPKRWQELRSTVWSDDSIQSFIRNSTLVLHRQLASCIGSGKAWQSGMPPCANLRLETTTGSFQENVNALEQTLFRRLKWMDEQVMTLYGRLDTTKCAPAIDAPLPQFNCAANGSDNGCLTDPEPYIAQVEFPPIHEPFHGPSCAESNSSNATVESPSLDPCWLSVGIYPSISPLTSFCSGHGFCIPGPEAKCNCFDGTTPPYCERSKEYPQAALAHKSTDPAEPSVWTSTSFSYGYVLAILCGVAIAMALYLVRCPSNSGREEHAAMSEEQTPSLSNAPVAQYGSAGDPLRGE